MKSDLHLHSNESDGLRSPFGLAEDANRAGLSVIAITDHDTVSGIEACQQAGASLGLHVIAGIELGCGRSEEVHVLGYGVPVHSKALDRFLDQQKQSRAERILAMLERLRALGISISPDEARSADTAFMGRMPLADALVRAGYVSSTDEAFLRFLREGGPAYVPRERASVCEGVAVLVSVGAIPVLAHPGRLMMPRESLRMLLPEWIEAGLSGIEAYHSSHSPEVCRFFDDIARVNGLLVTGGSDSHGREGRLRVGEVPRWDTEGEDVARLLEALSSKTEL